MTVIDLQKTLLAFGFKPGPIDGQIGPMTRAAIKAFQVSRGLVADGVAGPLTQAKLFPSIPLAPVSSVAAALPWYSEAKRLMGLREGSGDADNPIILKWADDLEIPYDHDEIPWCGLFVAHCMSFGLPDEALPLGVLGARNWLKFGREVVPQLGAVMVFWRGSKQGWSGHVGFYYGEDATTYSILGGNQSNAVTVTRVEKTRFLGALWPKMVVPFNLTGSGVAGPVSTNEA
jgi:uncharacterized protein (TIGR02594 family)